MGIKTIYSSKDNVNEVCNEIREHADGFDAKMVVYFSSVKYDLDALAIQMKQLFPQATVFGNSTAGEIVTGKMLKQSVVVMLLGPDVVEDVKVEVVENIKTGNNVPEAFKKFEDYYKTPMMGLDIEKYVGIILVDGMSGAEEKLMDKIGDLTDVSFIGASAGDDLQFKATYVFTEGKSYTNTALLALVKLVKGFDIIKTQSFCDARKNLKATKVDEASRTVIEFNGKPAAEAYAEALEVTVEEAADHFMSHPVGLMINDEPYIRSPQQFQDKNMLFYCNIKEGMDLNLMESTDIVSDTKKAVEDKVSELGGSVSGIIDFHCILRRLELDQKKQSEAYGKIFSDIPTVGFSTYGEEYIGHINQTSTMLVFK